MTATYADLLDYVVHLRKKVRVLEAIIDNERQLRQLLEDIIKATADQRGQT